MPRLVLVVLDTNVLISALLKRASKPGQILDLALEGQLNFSGLDRLGVVVQTPAEFLECNASLVQG